MRRRAHHRPERKPIFVGCEGDSEVSYIAFISDLAEAARLPVFIRPIALREGDPLSRVEKAIRLIDDNRKKRVDYAARFILMDSDQIALAPDRAEQAKLRAIKNKISIIWQDPCHEALLLRHFAGHETKRPKTAIASAKQLVKQWPGYTKGMSRQDIAKVLSLEAVRRAATVEQELKSFLTDIGLVTI